uniref:FAM3 metabolism regulating signaling molecule A n=1 Tax=Scleropages formosus TaxID=113540 RepID=A0A8C9QYX4_SCLFO
MRLAGPLRVVAVVFLVGLTWLLASNLFGGDSSFVKVRHFFHGTQDQTTPEPKPRKYKCGLSAPCPAKHLAFRITSGAANVIGPKICLEDKILFSSVKNNVGRGLNIALVNVIHDLSCRSDVSDLLKFLRPLHEGTLVFVASFDDPASKLNDEARRLFEELGSTAIKELAFRDSWVFVGAKGIENKSPFEQRMKNSKNTNKYEGWPESLEMDGCVPLRVSQDS